MKPSGLVLFGLDCHLRQRGLLLVLGREEGEMVGEGGGIDHVELQGGRPGPVVEEGGLRGSGVGQVDFYE